MSRQGDPLDVAGGPGGISVALDALASTAPRIRDAADDLARAALDLGAAALDPGVVVATTLAPACGLEAEIALARASGPSGLLGEAARLQWLAETLTLAVDSYRSGASTAESVVEGADRAVGVVLGAAAPAIVPAVLVGVSVQTVRETGPPLTPGATSAYLAAWVGNLADAPSAIGVTVDRAVFEHPWLLEHGVGGAEGMILGLGLGSPPLGAYLAHQAHRQGVAYPPRTQAEAVAVLAAAGAGHVLDESEHRVELMARPVDLTGWRPPGTLADLVAEDGPVSGDGDVRVTGLPLPDGRYAWVVDIPGTQTFDPRPGEKPWDLTSNVLLESGAPTLTSVAVTRALSDAKSRAGRGVTGARDPVLVGGHSQGGITAAALAASPTFRAQHPGVGHVVTTGAPIAGMRVPAGVSVLSVEHEQDLVPMLDGDGNPDRAAWVTVRRDVADELAGLPRASAAHDGDLYAATAVLVDREARHDPSLAAWRAGVGDFLGPLDEGGRHGVPGSEDGAGRPVVVVDYEVRRVPGSSARDLQGGA